MKPRASAAGYPWYDSRWLEQYWRAREAVAASRPEALAQFDRSFDRLRTRPDFSPVLLDQPFDAGTMARIRDEVRSLRPSDLELHEARRFHRFVVHDHPYFSALQERSAAMVSAAVGEEVESSYNFLSLYTDTGVCPMHMDAPEAKWTLDLCVDQAQPWPLYLGPVQPWPTPADIAQMGADWDARLRERAGDFSAVALRPGQAVVFSGSSQWHYRDAMPAASRAPGTYLFFHYVPRGTSRWVRPTEWARVFGVPEP